MVAAKNVRILVTQSFMGMTFIGIDRPWNGLRQCSTIPQRPSRDRIGLLDGIIVSKVIIPRRDGSRLYLGQV